MKRTFKMPAKPTGARPADAPPRERRTLSLRYGGMADAGEGAADAI